MRPTVPEPTNGLVLLKKEPGRTSFQALYPVKRLYGNTVGHTGTLDSFAQGLLVVLVGKFTKFNPLFTAFDKVYEADFTFGVETDTLDPTGTVVFEGKTIPDDRVPLLASRWIGPLMQIPPDYSAIHVQGKRASDRVRSGQILDLPARAVTVYSLDVVSWSSPVLTVRIHCSKGTYIRSIARDWGRAAGCGAYVTRLNRLRVGPFDLPEEPMEFKDALWSLNTLGIPVLEVPAESVLPVLNGRDPGVFVPGLDSQTSDRVGLISSQGKLFALVERVLSRWTYLFVDRGRDS